MTRSNGTYADIKENSSFLNSEFAINLAIKKFNLADEAELESIVGRYKKGKYKGQLKGQLKWYKVIAGGYVREVGIVPPNLTYAYHIIDFWSGEVLYPCVTGITDPTNFINFKISCLLEEMKKIEMLKAVSEYEITTVNDDEIKKSDFCTLFQLQNKIKHEYLSKLFPEFDLEYHHDSSEYNFNNQMDDWCYDRGLIHNLHWKKI